MNTYRLWPVGSGQRISGITRWRAAIMHLGISASIASVVLIAMIAVWFRPPYFEATRGSDLFMILMGVDVILGPLLTLIIFDTRKKGLKYDLAIVAAVQIGALLYGLNAIAASRPVYAVFVKDRFELVLSKDIDASDDERPASLKFERPPVIMGPEFIAAERPIEPKERERLLFSGLAGRDIQFFPQYYVPYEEQKVRAAAVGGRIEQLKKLNPNNTAAIERAIERSGRQGEQLSYLPLRTTNKDLTVLLDSKSGDVIAVISVSPW